MSLYLGGTKIKNVGITFEGTSGIDTSDATLTSGNQMLEGASAYSKGKKYSGTIPTKNVATPTISVSATGEISATVSQPEGYTAGATKKATQQLATQSAKTVTPTENAQTVVAANVYTTGAVKVGAIQTETKTVSTNGTYTPSEGKYFSSVTVNVPSSGSAAPVLQAKTTKPSLNEQVITADEGYDGLSSVTVNGIQTETKTITDNGTYTPTSGKYFNSVTVDVQPNLQAKTVEPSESVQTIISDSTYQGLSKVTVSAISNTYVGSGVPQKTAAIIVPSTTDQTLSAGQYLTGAQTIKGDSNLTASNIASGITIFGITGTHQGGGGIDTSDATAIANDIATGKTAYVNGVKVTGTMAVQNYYTGTATPPTSSGSDGDIYFKISR